MRISRSATKRCLISDRGASGSGAWGCGPGAGNTALRVPYPEGPAKAGHYDGSPTAYMKRPAKGGHYDGLPTPYVVSGFSRTVPQPRTLIVSGEVRRNRSALPAGRLVSLPAVERTTAVPAPPPATAPIAAPLPPPMMAPMIAPPAAGAPI